MVEKITALFIMQSFFERLLGLPMKEKFIFLKFLYLCRIYGYRSGSKSDVKIDRGSDCIQLP